MYYADALSGVASDSIRERAASGREKLIERTYSHSYEWGDITGRSVANEIWLTSFISRARRN